MWPEEYAKQCYRNARRGSGEAYAPPESWLLHGHKDFAQVAQFRVRPDAGHSEE